MPPLELTRELKAEALRLGFDRVGIAPAVAAPDHDRFREWLRAGHAAGMTYMEKHAAARRHAEHVLVGVRSIVMVSVVYGRPSEAVSWELEGKIARYAQGRDYHRVLWDRLDELLEWLRNASPGVRGRAVVDTAPLLERDFGRLAGLGWIGKNTMLIDRELGSFTFLGALLVDCELAPDKPHVTDHCGTCTRCLEACPTDAFAGPYQLDARRCISYWTIEHRGEIPEEHAGSLHGWVFGCDVCQDVCPWNRQAPSGRMGQLEEGRGDRPPNLVEWLDRDASAWKTALEGSALRRAKRAGLLRNAALVLGERRAAEAEPALARRLMDDNEDPAVRSAAAWALARLDTPTARAVLEQYHARW
ncbi:MAG: tRNA epoxyqueuosine(34) reductase QueG [Isosphaeraceae bacterium]